MSIKIYFGYKSLSKPLGGANSFLRALNNLILKSNEFEIVDNIEKVPDIILLNQLNKGGGTEQKYKIQDILNIKSLYPNCKIVTRAVNLKSHSHGLGVRSFFKNYNEDKNTIKLLNMSDFVIFQSNYQLNFFREKGFCSPLFKVIHNGADDKFLQIRRIKNNIYKDINLISSTASPRATKKHDLILELSKIKNIKIVHFGRWPDNLSSNNIKLMGVCNHEDICRALANSHGFVHTAIKDPCPNSIFEALASGLPVLYNDSLGSSKEIVKDYGLPLDFSNLKHSISSFVKDYDKITAKLKKKREIFSINFSGQKYLDLFRLLKD